MFEVCRQPERFVEEIVIEGEHTPNCCVWRRFPPPPTCMWWGEIYTVTTFDYYASPAGVKMGFTPGFGVKEPTKNRVTETIVIHNTCEE